MTPDASAVLASYRHSALASPGTSHAVALAMKHSTAILGVVLSSVTACGGPDFEASDEGTLCLYGADPSSDGVDHDAQNYDAGAPVYVTVRYGDCISACVQNKVATCSVTQDGDSLTVHSHFSYDDPPAEEVCIALCGTLGALKAEAYTQTSPQRRRRQQRRIASKRTNRWRKT